MPDELNQMIQDKQEFEKTCLMNEKLVLSRPRTSQNAQSRFFKNHTREMEIMSMAVKVGSPSNNLGEHMIHAEMIEQGELTQ